MNELEIELLSAEYSRILFFELPPEGPPVTEEELMQMQDFFGSAFLGLTKPSKVDIVERPQKGCRTVMVVWLTTEEVTLELFEILKQSVSLWMGRHFGG